MWAIFSIKFVTTLKKKKKNIFHKNMLFILTSNGGGDGFVAKLCPTLCGPMDCDLPGSSVRGISQAGILEWAAISFSRVTWNNSTIIIFIFCCYF